MARERATRQSGPAAIRRADIEPYTALHWVGTLFKAAAVFLAVALFTEFMVGLQMDGASALPELLGELARTAVVAVVLWGVGDLVRLLIHVGHDVRAQRILLGRLVNRSPAPERGERVPPWGSDTAGIRDRADGVRREIRVERIGGSGKVSGPAA